MTHVTDSPIKPPQTIDWSKVAPIGLHIKGVELYPAWERQQFQELFILAAVLLFAIEGEDAPIKERFEWYLRFVETPVGNSLAVMAGEARKRGPWTWAAFSESMKYEGTLYAAIAWLKLVPKNKSIELYLEREKTGMCDAEADYWNRQLRSDMGMNLLDLKAFINDWTKKQAALVKAKSRQQSNQTMTDGKYHNSLLREVLKRDWVIAALWCRTTKGLLEYFYWLPQKTETDVTTSIKKIDRTISELCLANSRCTDLEPMIENAVKALRDKMEKHLLSSQER